VRTPLERLAPAGCAVLAFVLVGYATYAVITMPAARFGIAGLLAAIPLTILWERWRLARSVRSFRQLHGARDLLLVYTDSPHWQEYIEQRWIPRWEGRAVVLNRSSPDWNNRPEAALWRRVAGRSDHTPVAILLPSSGRPRVFRFYRAFLDRKHGKDTALRALEAELTNALEPPPDDSRRD